MSDLLGVTVDDLVAALKRRRAPLPFEIGSFVALQTAEALLDRPARVTPQEVRVASDGGIAVFAPPNSASEAEAAQSVISLLAFLLVAAGPGVPPALLSLVDRGPVGTQPLAELRDELEASLVPLNRAAARRVLSRLLREASRESTSQPKQQAIQAPRERAPAPQPAQVPSTSIDSMDDDLDALLAKRMTGAMPAVAAPVIRTEPQTEDIELPEEARDLSEESTRLRLSPVSDRPAPPSERSGTSSVDALLDDLDPGLAKTEHAQPAIPKAPRVPTLDAKPAKPSKEDKKRREAEERRREEEAAARERDRERDRGRGRGTDSSIASLAPPGASHPPGSSMFPKTTTGFSQLAGKKSRGWVAFLVFFIASAALAGVVVYLRPDVIAKLRGQQTPEEIAAAAQAAAQRAARQREAQRMRERYGDLVVRVTPERAQVFLFVGRGPVEVKNLPTGVAYEFVAIQDGLTPARALVPPSAQWESTPDGKRYELAIQIPDAPMPVDRLDLGTSKMPQDVGTPAEQFGQVRIVTSPPGAKVFQLVGFSPDVRVRDIPSDQGIDLLVYLAGHVVQRRVVGPSDWRTGDDGKKIAEIDLTLEPMAPAPTARR